jgi:hypothetical protein
LIGGGNREAARRAGINVKRIYTSAFVLCATLAAVGGVLAAARLAASSQQAGTGDVTVTAVDWPKLSILQVVYHLYSYKHRHAFVLKVGSSFVAGTPLGKETPENRDKTRKGGDVVRLLAGEQEPSR